MGRSRIFGLHGPDADRDVFRTTGNRGSSAKPPPIAAKIERTTKIERIELAIDSIQGYDLIKSIPVLIESLGDKVFVAEAPT